VQVNKPTNNRRIRIVCISDTHELHRELTVPDGDLLIHAGDFTMFGKGTRAIIDFNGWLGELPHPYKVITCDNHEFAIEADPRLRRLITNATLLINEAAIVSGIKIWGSPLTQHYGGAFGRSNAADRIRIYNTIPMDTDILVTHGPPFGILDNSPDDYAGPAGDRELREAVVRVKPKVHIFGHIHSSYGIHPTRHTMFVNAALFCPDASLNKPIVFEISNLNFK
jgi:predicted phosphohydrolase